MKPEHIDGVIECVYEAWKDNPWFQKIKPEVIKQSLFDRINHYGVMEKSVVCIQTDKNKIVGVMFGQSVPTYLETNMKWNFHQHFEVIEKFIKLVSEKMAQNFDLSKCIWPFWLSSIVPNSKIAEFLMILSSYVHIETGYQFHISFTNHAKSRHITGKYQATQIEPIQLKNLQGANFEKDITLHPHVIDLFKTRDTFFKQVNDVINQFPKI